MTIYAPQFASAQSLVARKGASVSFTRLTDTLDPTTGDATAPVVTTVTGSAVRVRGNPIRYAELGLKLTEAVTLLFVPATMDTLPALDSSVTWDSIVYLVKDVDPLEPDGEAILARITVAR